MGWYATAQALKKGEGPYGTVKESLKGESDPPATLSTALAQICVEIVDKTYTPDRNARIRILYWAKRNGSKERVRDILLRHNKKPPR